MRVILPRINAQRFAQGFSKALAQRAIKERLDPILDGVGEERIRWLIENDQTLYTRFPESLYADVKGYNWMLKAFSPQDLIDMLPERLVKLCDSYGEQGKVWLRREVDGIKTLLGG